MQPRDFDECECGDYRHQHNNGSGSCRVCEYANKTLPKCVEFRLARVSDMGLDSKVDQIQEAPAPLVAEDGLPALEPWTMEDRKLRALSELHEEKHGWDKIDYALALGQREDQLREALLKQGGESERDAVIRECAAAVCVICAGINDEVSPIPEFKEWWPGFSPSWGHAVKNSGKKGHPCTAENIVELLTDGKGGER